MKREFYEFAGEVSDDNVIETELREELIAKDFIKKINRSFVRNVVWMALNSVALSILSLIFQTLGIKILVSGSMYTLLMLGLGISYLLIFVGTILMNLQTTSISFYRPNLLITIRCGIIWYGLRCFLCNILACSLADHQEMFCSI